MLSQELMFSVQRNKTLRAVRYLYVSDHLGF